ncbi:ABC transporter permease [Paracoccus marinaquae]|uniref:ABC transporter permease n=1 Tax=Paracoccus marinaquae TaxID=2841926 RepID=A0ABS6AJG5_9RHOB|nr:ABC transporter permease [Paracoccus marinaquae]MBU3030734.1 ABC transporter permease [Paracoccus marinaquae]
MADQGAIDSDGVKPPKGFLDWLKRLLRIREGMLLMILVVSFIIMSFASEHFLTWGNMRAVLLSFSTEGIVVVGMTMLIIVGGIDLSVGAAMCLAMVVAGKLFLIGMNPWLASLFGVGATALAGFVMGMFVTRVGLSFFITSLAFFGLLRGIGFIITEGTPLSLFTLPPSFKYIGQGNFYGVPVVIIIFFVVAVIGDILLRKASAFRKVIYVGSNEHAANYAGINVRNVRLWTTVLCSSLAGFAGIMFMARLGVATPTFGIGSELNIIAAAVIGGASLNGGKGSVLGAILGIALLSLVTSSMILLDISIFWQDTIRSLILLAAVSIDHLVNKHR